MGRYSDAPRIDKYVRDGEELFLGDQGVKVFETPGHTPDSISLYASGRVYTGDVLFIGGCGRTDFAGGDPRQSVRKKGGN
jgi:glyoxylase-like metal-dependent hydrolase (beta-lactamase superfamily II)